MVAQQEPDRYQGVAQQLCMIRLFSGCPAETWRTANADLSIHQSLVSLVKMTVKATHEVSQEFQQPNEDHIAQSGRAPLHMRR